MDGGVGGGNPVELRIDAANATMEHLNISQVGQCGCLGKAGSSSAKKVAQQQAK